MAEAGLGVLNGADSGERSDGRVIAQEEGPESGASGVASEQEVLLQRTACFYSECLTPSVEQEVQQLETCLEEMLTRVDEFCGMLDMIRNDSSQIMNENIPEIHAKADEMKQMYKKIDKLEAFVKMIGKNLSSLDDQVTQAEAELGTFPSAFKKILHSFSSSAFFNKPSFPKKQQQKFEVAPLFRTEDYFPASNFQEHE
ncbi:biogenesis of lysosome-related organelles complex 1 subunit 4 [Hypanus sabinus]|uniref:biogenesis of lysosome-related organelles complex 1 subunit 4 n=1 Tax=Hypanus sabinus TaxID=79690 RepID=UPI0028C4DE0E|nr:biogenesis of lysosome-related organelles complex 1 subunit 4 [Hypanus sabinus]